MTFPVALANAFLTNSEENYSIEAKGPFVYGKNERFVLRVNNKTRAKLIATLLLDTITIVGVILVAHYFYKHRKVSQIALYTGAAAYATMMLVALAIVKSRIPLFVEKRFRDARNAHYVEFGAQTLERVIDETGGIEQFVQLCREHDVDLQIGRAAIERYVDNHPGALRTVPHLGELHRQLEIRT